MSKMLIELEIAAAEPTIKKSLPALALRKAGKQCLIYG